MRNSLRVYAAALAGLALAGPAHAVDQTVPGAGNATATAIAEASPFIRSALARLKLAVGGIHDRVLREQTFDALFNKRTCIYHRSEMTAAKKQRIVDALQAAGLFANVDAAAFPGGALAGVFPPVLDEDTTCPQLPQGFGVAPGSSFGGHQSYPGGLPVHEGFNLSSALAFADNYESAYGHADASGLPTMLSLPASTEKNPGDLDISRDEITAAPLWHDWAKSIVFQWNADGTEFAEFSFGGAGMTDDYGTAGDSRTGGHHIISLAESIARHLPAQFVIVQASAHSAPTLGSEFKVVNWLRAAAIIAEADPVARGLLVHDASGNLRLPPTKSSAEIDLLTAGQTNFVVEDTIHNLSDADFTFTIPAITTSQVVLADLASHYGYDPTDVARYNNSYRNPALSNLSAERIFILFTRQGLGAVQTQLDLLRAKGAI